MSDIRAVILDVNGTLYSINKAAGPAFEQLGLNPDLVEVGSWGRVHPNLGVDLRGQ